jgi:hypothetical protein
MRALTHGAAMDGRFLTLAVREDRKNTAMDGRFLILAITDDRKNGKHQP